LNAVEAATKGRPAVDHIGIDVHKRESQICILTEGGEFIEQRIRTEKSRLRAVLGPRPRARVLIEASTESEWVARCLEDLGHEVVVADPNFAPMYGARNRKVKTDRRDARALMEACRVGAYRRAHRVSDRQRQVRGQLAVREALVRTRTRYIAVIGALLRQQGIRVRGGGAERFVMRLQELTIPISLQEAIVPLVGVLGPLNRQIERASAAIVGVAESDPVVQQLCTVPGIGAVTAATFVATVDGVERFAGAHQVEAYLGLVPREFSSGERQCKGRITKAGNSRARWLLVEAAWSILRYKKPETAALRTWAERIACRRGKRRAAVALARRLAGILYAMMRDQTDYQPESVPRAGCPPAVAA
jgi:transposase